MAADKSGPIESGRDSQVKAKVHPQEIRGDSKGKKKLGRRVDSKRKKKSGTCRTVTSYSISKSDREEDSDR